MGFDDVLEEDRRTLGHILSRGFEVKLAAFELKTLDKNGVLFKKVPSINKNGMPHPKKNVLVPILQDDVCDYGRIYLRRDKGRVMPIRKRRR